MPGTKYPKQQMHRIAYTKLTPQQIAAKLAPAAAAGPTSASPLLDGLAGNTSKIVTDSGPTLVYKFKDKTRMSVSENGGKAVDAGYAALEMGPIIVLSHLIPGTQRGYTVVFDHRTGLVTVAELWFSGYQDNREVQRQLYYGYLDEGKEGPKARHVLSNRIEGHGYHWKQDNGIETLEFYPSAAYSHFVELTRLGGELGFCGPSDYVRIDDDYFIYTRTECEFSGTFTLYVIDLNRIEQAGVRLGFNADDALEYYLFRGKGEWLGTIAQFEKFGDVSGNPFPPPAAGTPAATAAAAKGFRRVYRPLQTMPKMTREQVDAACIKKTTAFAPRSQMAGNSLPVSGYMSGKTFTLRYDSGLAIEYRVSDSETLEWRKPGGTWTKARYQGFEAAPGLIAFGHLLEGEPDHDGHMIAADFDHGLVTCFNGHLNTPYFANEAGCKVHFGVIEMEGLTPPKYRRHGFTDELLGRVLSWNYQPGLTSMHLYSTPHSMSWIIFTDSGAGGTEWSGPAGYVKLRDELYYLYWLEEACNGTLGTIVVNLRTMHDAGIDYHCGDQGLTIGPVGAHARHAGRFDIARFHQYPFVRQAAMTDNTSATRRSFLKGGAVAAAPLAAAGAVAMIADQDHRARLARLQDEAAIRDLHQTWLRRINTGERADAAALFVDAEAAVHAGISRVAADHAAAPDEIKLAADGRSASGVYACVVETETPRALDCTLAQMAHAQGEGMVRTSERRVLKARYVKGEQGWAIETLRLEPA